MLSAFLIYDIFNLLWVSWAVNSFVNFGMSVERLGWKNLDSVVVRFLYYR